MGYMAALSLILLYDLKNIVHLMKTGQIVKWDKHKSCKPCENHSQIFAQAFYIQAW